MTHNNQVVAGKVLGYLLILEVATVLIPFFILSAAFEFPDILRQPAEKAFSLFQQNEKIIVPAYYCFLASSLLYLPLASLLKNQYAGKTKHPIWLQIMYVSAIATAIFQAIGFSRWIFAMPFLSSQYANGGNKEMIGLLYEWVNRFVGTTVGEHLGFLAMGIWLIALAIAITNARRFKTSGVLIGLLLMASVLEHFGGSATTLFAFLNVLANVLWTIWMLILSFSLLRTNKSLIIVSEPGKSSLVTPLSCL